MTTNTDVIVTGRVADGLSGVASLQAQVDSGPLRTVSFDPSGDFRFDLALPLDGSADGQHTVRLQATDRAGNRSADVSVPFTLDTTAPTVSVLSPPRTW